MRASKPRLLALALFVAAAIGAHGQTILPRDQAGPLLPATVFFKGQVAPVQTRNSAGLRTATTQLILVALVDTSGYSSAVQQTYQGYLLTEVPLILGTRHLLPGAYGFGFVGGDEAVVLDLGGNELFHTPTMRDAALPRPSPLQIQTDPTSKSRFRLYLGRSFITLETAQK